MGDCRVFILIQKLSDEINDFMKGNSFSEAFECFNRKILIELKRKKNMHSSFGKTFLIIKITTKTRSAYEIKLMRFERTAHYANPLINFNC